MTGWKTRQRKAIANVDLFRKLDKIIAAEERNGLAVGLWLIPRSVTLRLQLLAKFSLTSHKQFNKAADRLATNAVKMFSRNPMTAIGH